MTDERDEIRARVDIVELIGGRVALKRAGKHFKGLCPFHADRNPSFYVDPQTGRYRCWSCGESGDAFTWVMKTQNVDFVEALRELAQRTGVTLQNRGPSVPPSVREAQRAAMAEALNFFREQLGRNSNALAYCDRRGLDSAVRDLWEIGYGPDVGEALAIHLKRKGFSLAECQGLFLVDQDASGGYYDRFRGRLMFPIRDEKGELVAFGGRLLGDGHPKYINSSDTPLYKKSRVLYGMHQARERLGKERRAVLVEGYMDVVACHRAGVTQALASLGTALSEDHAKLLKRWVEEVVVLYDSDEAGRKAADRAVDVLRAEGIGVRVALMPKGDDPDTLLKNEGPQAVVRAVEQGLTPMEYRLQALEQRLPPGEPEFWEAAVDIMAEAPSDLEAATNLNRLASQYPGVRDLSEAMRVLKRMVAQRRRALRTAPADGPADFKAPAPIPMRPPLSAAELVVFRALHDVTYQRFAWMTIVNAVRNDLFVTQSAIELAQAVAAAFPSAPPNGEASGWIHSIEPEEMRRLLSDVVFDLRAERLSEPVLMDTIELLKRQAESRQLLRTKQNETSQQQRLAILERLKRLKPDPRMQKNPEDDDPYT